MGGRMALTLRQSKSLADLANSNNIELAALVAFINVESDGQIFTKNTFDMIGTNLPVIRWEGHYFYKLLKGDDRVDAVAAKLASPNAGSIKNPKNQAARYEILRKAIEINEDSAYSSISIGVGQVMGSHAVKLGFSSAKAMFDQARVGLEGQVELIVRFLKAFDLKDEIQRRDWSALARGYNGPGYRKNAYDTKLAAAYDAATALLNDKPAMLTGTASTMLRLGSKGVRVRELQQLLRRAGLAINVDGDFGTSTKEAVKTFQKLNRLTADGVVGPKTYDALTDFKVDPQERPGEQSITELPESRTASLSAGAGIGVAAAADKINDLADKLSIGGGEIFSHISSALYMGAGTLVIGGMVWAAYGYLRSKQTFEGTN